jgi:hypothetical protein
LIIPDAMLEQITILKDQYLDLAGLAAYSGLSRTTLRDHVKLRGLPAYLVEGKILVRRSEFDSWISRYRVKQSQNLKSVVDEVMSRMRGPRVNSRKAKPDVEEGKA